MRCWRCQAILEGNAPLSCPYCGARCSAPEALPAGAQLKGGVYRIEAAKGGDAVNLCYEAEHLPSGRRVWIRELLLSACVLGRGPGAEVQVRPEREELWFKAYDRFRREAELLLQARHPSLQLLIDWFEERGTVYQVLEPPPEGASLWTLLREHPLGGGLEEALVVSWLLQIAEGLESLHELGWLHLDLRPEQVHIGPDRRAVLLGYAGARRMIELYLNALSADFFTPPELLTGRELSPAADVYGLALVGAVALLGFRWLKKRARPEIAELEEAFSDSPWRSVLRAGLEPNPRARPPRVSLWVRNVPLRAMLWGTSPAAGSDGPAKLGTRSIWGQHVAAIEALAWHPRGGRWATAGADGTVRLWDLDPLGCRAVLRNPSGPVLSLTWEPDGEHLLTGGLHQSAESESEFCGELRRWRLADGTCVEVVLAHRYSITALDCSPDGRWLATGGGDGRVGIWNREHLEPLRLLAGHEHVVGVVRFSPDGRYLASSSWHADLARQWVRGEVRIWEVSSGRCVRIIRAHDRNILDMAWLDGGACIASAGLDGRVLIWDWLHGVQKQSLTVHRNGLVSLDLSPDGQLLAAAGEDGRLYLWNVPQGRLLRQLSGHTATPCRVRWSPKPQEGLLSSDERGDLLYWDHFRQTAQLLGGGLPSVRGLAWEPGARRIWIAGPYGIERWRYPEGLWERSLWHSERPILRLVPHQGGTLLAIVLEQEVQIWDSREHRRVGVFSLEADPSCLVWSPEGRYLAVGRREGGLVVLNPLTGRPLLEAFRGEPVYALAWHPEAALLYVAFGNGSLWQLALDSSSPHPIGAQEHPIRFLVPLSRPDHLLTADQRGAWRVWNIASRRVSAPVVAHPEGAITALCVWGRTLYTGSEKGQIRVWNWGDRQLYTELKGHNGAITVLMPDPEGGGLFSGAEDGDVRYWVPLP